MKSWEPQPWWLLIAIPLVIVVFGVCGYMMAQPSPPQVINVHIDGPIHVILDKAPQ